MSCLTRESLDVVAADVMERLAGAGIPIREVLSQSSLEGLLQDILREGFTVEDIVVHPTYSFPWLPRMITRRYRYSPRMRAVARELVEDGFVPKECIRAHTYGDYVLVDRRRARRIARRVREFSIKRSIRNGTIRRNCQR